MRFESINLNNENQASENPKNSERFEDADNESIELDMSPEDFAKLEILRHKIENIAASGYENSKKFEESKNIFLKKLNEDFEESELNKIASLSLLRGEGLSPETNTFDLNGQYSVVDFVNSFIK